MIHGQLLIKKLVLHLKKYEYRVFKLTYFPIKITIKSNTHEVLRNLTAVSKLTSGHVMFIRNPFVFTCISECWLSHMSPNILRTSSM